MNQAIIVCERRRPDINHRESERKERSWDVKLRIVRVDLRTPRVRFRVDRVGRRTDRVGRRDKKRERRSIVVVRRVTRRLCWRSRATQAIGRFDDRTEVSRDRHQQGVSRGDLSRTGHCLGASEERICNLEMRPRTRRSLCSVAGARRRKTGEITLGAGAAIPMTAPAWQSPTRPPRSPI